MLQWVSMEQKWCYYTVRSTSKCRAPPVTWPSGQVTSNMDIYICLTFSKQVKREVDLTLY